MNYTKNYHLPQWVKSDRLMMDDFNAAMADIESGLTQNAQTAAAANSKTAGDAASATTAAETRALARLRKLGYDLSQINARGIIAGAQPGRTKCLAYNGLSTPEEKSRAVGFRCAPDRQGAQLGPHTALNLEQLSTEIISCKTTPKEYEGNTSASQTVKFHCSQPGTITQLVIWLRSEYHLVPPYATMTCIDVETSQQVYIMHSSQLSPQPEEYGTQTLDVNIPLEAGHTYQLEIYTTSSVFIGSIGFGDEAQTAFAGSVTTQQLSSGTIQESLTLDLPAHIAMAVIHYTGGSTAPVLTAGGKTLVPQYTRQGTAIRGQDCTEREYYLESAWTGTVPLTVSCQSSNQDLTVYDVEFCLI